MTKFVKFVMVFVGLIFVSAIAFPTLIYWADQPQQRKIQNRVLNNSFTSVQPQNGKVRFVPLHPYNGMQILNAPNSAFDTPTLLSIGSQFRKPDRHFLIKYTISQIETDGVRIDYEASGGEPSGIRPSRGSVKLGWK